MPTLLQRIRLGRQVRKLERDGLLDESADELLG
jgi:hypothetical protein